MRGAVLRAPDDLVVEELETPTPGPDEVLLETTAAGLCHSDLLHLHGTLPFAGPTVLGHEGAGRVLAVGERVTAVSPGDRVVVAWIPACGHCAWCQDGQAHLCKTLDAKVKTPRLRRADESLAIRGSGVGTFSDTMVLDEHSMVRVQTELPDAHLALIGCGVTTGVGAVFNTAAVRPGQSVAVIGCGGVGYSVIQAARIAGAEPVIVLDPVPGKRSAARAAGATHALDPSDEGIADEIRALTRGRGVDVAFECSGHAAGLAVSWPITRRGGTIVTVGAQAMDTAFPWPAVAQVFEEKRVLGCLYGSAQIHRDIPLIVSLVEAGRLDLETMVSRTLSLDQVVDGLAAIEGGEVVRQVISVAGSHPVGATADGVRTEDAQATRDSRIS